MLHDSDPPLNEDEWPDADDVAEDPEDCLIDCPACGRAIHEEAPRCPHCGRWVEEAAESMRRPWRWIAVVVLLVLLILMFWHGAIALF